METQILSNMSDLFKIPIEYEKKVNLLNENLITDLELNGVTSPYYKLFNIKDVNNTSNICEYTDVSYIIPNIETLLLKKWSAQFSDSRKFIKNHQKYIRLYRKLIFKNNNKTESDDYNVQELLEDFISHKLNEGFNEKYEYITWEHAEFINKSPKFLQALTYYNLLSPVINLTLPILLLLMPFIVIKFVMRAPITFQTYKEILSKQLKNHSLGKIFSLFSSEVTTDKKLFAAISIAFYIFTLYQNTLTCIKFYQNSYKIHSYLYNIKNHLNNSKTYICNLIDVFTKIKHFDPYRNYLSERKDKIVDVLTRIDMVQHKTFNIKNINNFGHYLAMFYDLRNDKDVHDIMCFTFGLHCYRSNMNALCSHLERGVLQPCKLIKNVEDAVIKEQIYIHHLDSETTPIKNDINLGNYTITGPNASGKTTLLKTTMLNVIFSQQFGFGFYSSARIYPYRQIHSYINIPDTSGRDSLFQAEARRCLEILNAIRNCKKGVTFVIFDEIYSGTNPYEATQSATAFLEYLKKENVHFLLTTHFQELTTIENIHHYHMDCAVDGDSFEYTYKFTPGSSDIKGGFKVLEEMNYPDEIIKKLHS